MKFNAFISYSHAQDNDLGTSIEKALEKFAKPTFKRRALEIFRDANDLNLASDLGDKIRNGLQESEYFVCLASSRYAQSKWCQREVAYWLEHKPIDKFIIVLTEGEISYNDEINDFDWDKTTALPQNLSGVFKGTPFYLDFRNLGGIENHRMDNPEFRKRLVLLAATIHGKSVGDMEGEAVRHHKRTMRIRNAAIAVLSVLLVLAIGASIFAVNKKNEALLATYIANSQGQFNEDPTKSLRLAETAYRFAEEKKFSTTEAAEQLIKVFYSGNGFYQDPGLEWPAFPAEANPSVDARFGVSRIHYLMDSIVNSIPRDEYLMNQSAYYLDPSENSATLVVSSNALNFSRIYFIDEEMGGYTITNGNILLPGFGGYTGYIQDIEITEDGRLTLLGSANGKTAILENNAFRYNADRDVFKVRAILQSSESFPVDDVAFFKDHGLIGVVSTESEYVNGIRQDKDKVRYYYKIPPYPYIEMVNTDSEFGNESLDSKYYMMPVNRDSDPFTWFHYEQQIKNDAGEVVMEFPDAQAASSEMMTSPDQAYQANYQGVFNAHGDLLITLNLDIIDNPGIAMSFSEDSRFLKVSYLDGLQRIFALDPEFIIDRINDTEALGQIAPLTEADKDRFLIAD